jgi:hypothetical protein
MQKVARVMPTRKAIVKQAPFTRKKAARYVTPIGKKAVRNKQRNNNALKKQGLSNHTIIGI